MGTVMAGRPIAFENTRAGRIHACVRHALLATALIPSALAGLAPLAAAGQDGRVHSRFPAPPALHANVEFWKRIYGEFGVGDFVLHDRDNLAILYGVVQVTGITDVRRANETARPEIERQRAKYIGILTSLARGADPEELGFEGRWVAQEWECPCPPEVLLRASGNIRVQQGLREQVDEGMQRARRLLPGILTVLRRYDMPEELAALPLVESAFNPHARSKAGAVGLWQLIPSTGRRYLKITRKRDDRRDPILATDAAARLLKRNYEALGSWPLALMAYHHGEQGTQAARAAAGSSAIEEIIARYKGPRFGFASRNFYAEFLAALEIVRPTILQHTRQSENRTPEPRLSGGG